MPSGITCTSLVLDPSYNDGATCYRGIDHWSATLYESGEPLKTIPEEDIAYAAMPLAWSALGPKSILYVQDIVYVTRD